MLKHRTSQKDSFGKYFKDAAPVPLQSEQNSRLTELELNELDKNKWRV